ncbi:MAG TPA: hypothetical protein VKT54_08205 [Steroidobacteraceae bacterium]|nr:hypothetical protein [Steroidobacteraceae bacterium]
MDTLREESRRDTRADEAMPRESPRSAISWGAIIGGAVVAAAVSLVLIALGAGFDLAAVSPWSGSGASVTTFTAMTAIWFIVIQWLASAVGGYLTGRLRTQWVNTHAHEVFFRDTAHGLVTWALASVLAAAVLTSTATSLTAGGLRAATTLASGAGASGAAASDNTRGTAAGSYDLDVLLRGREASSDSAAPALADARAQAMRILANGLANHGVPAGDRRYLAQLVAARTGTSQAEAEQRVDTFIEHSQQAADRARKTASAIALFTALSMLIGAFIACVAAAIGGRSRDEELAPVPR